MERTRLLLVDDDPAFVDSLRDLLLDDGYDVDVALDGREGLEQARRHRPDLVVLDLSMPNLNGQGFLTARAAEVDLARVPVLVFTAVDEPQPPPPVAVFEKPLGLPRLLEAIHRLAPGPPAAA